MTHSTRLYEAGDFAMVYEEFDSRALRTLVLIHGIGMGRIVFDGVAELLGAHHRILAVDLPGFGDSPEPGSAASLEETAEVVGQFILACARSGPVTLIGHSMGTQIATEIALSHPSLVDSLALIAPTVNRHERTARKQALRMLQDLWGESPKVMLLGFWEYMKTSPWWFVRKLRYMLAHQLEDRAPAVTVPTLVMRGETDRVCPRDWVAEVTSLIPRARMVEISGRGHEAIIRSPEPVATLIRDFISEVDQGIFASQSG